MAVKPRHVRKLDAQELLAYALNLLGARALSAGEVRTRLNRKAASAEDVEPVLAKLREYGYLNDARFAETFAAVRKESGSFGKARVLRDLRQRRVAPSVAEHAVRTAYEGADELAMVQQWLTRKFRGVCLSEYLQEDKHLASAYRKLRYAGFSSGVAIRALKQFCKRADELSDPEPGEI